MNIYTFIIGVLILLCGILCLMLVLAKCDNIKQFDLQISIHEGIKFKSLFYKKQQKCRSERKIEEVRGKPVMAFSFFYPKKFEFHFKFQYIYFSLLSSLKSVLFASSITLLISSSGTSSINFDTASTIGFNVTFAN